MNNEAIKKEKKYSLVWIAVVYLLGLFIGAIDTGIITPARTIIQNDLDVDPTLGIWMITIYTLTYAAVIPISGKMADKRGRKPVYILSIALFGIGSVICAISATMDSFTILMLGRVVQASGAGGIMPVATAEFGTSFPEEKRGMALGLVGAVYGIANVVGASVGSAILDIVGTSNWQWIFLVNVPICIFIVITGIFVLPNNKADEILPTDKLGTLLMTLIILSLLYGLKNLDFFDFINSIQEKDVWPFLVFSLVLIPIFAIIEKRAADPIFHIEYIGQRQIMITLVLGIVVGTSLMGLIFVPQFSENALKMEAGSGGYFVVILGLCAGVSSMGSGKMIDKMGAKPVMAMGFITTIVGCLYLILITLSHLNLVNVIISLLLLGLGLGFTMGTPLNYMMLQNTSDEESNSALATLSLVRSIGTAVAPAIMVGFITHAAFGIQDDIMNVLPTEMSIGQLPYAKEIDATIEKYQNDPDMAEQFGDMDIPKVSDMNKVEIDMEGDGDFEMPDKLINRLQNSDVTTITDDTVYMTRYMFKEMSPEIKKKATEGIEEGIDGIKTGRNELSSAVAEMREGYDGMGEGIAGMQSGVSQMRTAEKQLDNAISQLKDTTALTSLKAQQKKLKDSVYSMTKARDSMKEYIPMLESMPEGKLPEGKTLADFIPEEAKAKIPADVLKKLATVTSAADLKNICEQMTAGINGQQQAINGMQDGINTLQMLKDKGRVPKGKSLLDVMPDSVKSKLPSDVKKKLAKANSIQDLRDMKSELVGGRKELQGKIAEMQSARAEMLSAMNEMNASVDEMNTLIKQMTALDKALPEAIDEAGEKYAKEVRAKGPEIEKVYQDTLNDGYKNMYIFLIVVNAFGLLLLMFYRERRNENSAE